MWLCLDATNRRLSQPVAGGLADPIELDREVNAVLAHHKASLSASTIRHLTAQLPQLTSRNLLPGTRFVPLIVIPEDGLPWTLRALQGPGDLDSVRDAASQSRTPLGAITVDDLGLVERAVEEGANAGDLLSRWRSEHPEVPLQRFLHTRGMPLRRPRREVETFERLTDELLDRMTGYQDGVTGS
ncbi:hypothetical protein [Micromonospora sp. DT63]|uniref:hypothetical protein n=1 Tax=Micromonospora sp. DT63 TaxID=3393441 RepID=UPI003CEDBFF6